VLDLWHFYFLEPSVHSFKFVEQPLREKCLTGYVGIDHDAYVIVLDMYCIDQSLAYYSWRLITERHYKVTLHYITLLSDSLLTNSRTDIERFLESSLSEGVGGFDLSVLITFPFDSVHYYFLEIVFQQHFYKLHQNKKVKIYKMCARLP